MTECPTCGDDFKTEGGMKSHHAQAHGTSIAGYNYTCHWCGESGRKRQIDDRDDHQFCSTDCYHEWRKETLVGENSPAWEGKTVTVNCDWCGGEAEKAQCRLQKNQRAFCSQDCHGQWLSENNTGRSNPQWEGRLNDVGCDQCGTTFKRDPSKLERNTHNFCCKQCYSEWMSDHRTGENHPRWKEGRRLSYGPNWHKKRQERLEKDGEMCVVCGLNNNKHVEMYGCELHVHHIQPLKNFAEEDNSVNHERANRLENLITLCRKCHNRWEGIPVKPKVQP